MSTNPNHAHLFARAQQTTVLVQDVRAHTTQAKRDAAAIDKELARPIRPDLPTGIQGPPTAAGVPIATVEHMLGTAVQEHDEVMKSIEEMQEELATRTAKFKAELAAAAERSAPNGWNELPSSVEDMVKVAQEIMRGVGAQDRLPSIEPEHQDIVRETPESLLQERADHAGNLERISELETSLNYMEQSNSAHKKANQGLKERLSEARAQKRDVEYELSSARVEISSYAGEVEHFNAEIQALVEQLEGREEELANSRATEAGLDIALAECEAKMAEDQRTAAEQIGILDGQCALLESEAARAQAALEKCEAEAAQLRAAVEESKSAERRAAEGLADSESKVARLAKEAEKCRAELEAVERGAEAKLSTSQTRIQDLEREAQGMATEIKARDAEVQQLKAQAVADREELDRLRQLATNRGDRVLVLEGRIVGLETTVKDQGQELQAKTKDIVSTSGKLQDVMNESNERAREAASLTRQVACVEEKLSAKAAEGTMLSDQLREVRANLATKSTEATSSAADVERLASDLHTMTRDRDSNVAEAQRLAGELAVKDAEVKAKDVETSMLDKSLQTKAALVNQLSDELTARTNDVVKVSQRAREEAVKGDELRVQLKNQTKETERISEELREQTAKADGLDKRAQEESSKAETLSAQLENEVAKGDELRRQLDGQTKETERISEALREQDAKVNALSDALQRQTARAQEESSKAETLSVRLKSETATSASNIAEARELADKCHGLTQKLEEREAAGKAMSSRLQQADESIMALQRELEAQTTATGNVRVQVTDLQSTVAEMCAHMTGKQLEPAQWVEIWAATREQTQIPAEQPSTEYWVVGQSVAVDHKPCEPQVSGLRMLCLHVTAAIRAGEWGNEAIALTDLLMKELNKEQPLPVDGLLLVVSATVDGARAHADEILLVAIWQLAVYLHEAFPGEPRFGVQRAAIDEELHHSPWCQRVTQAIATGSVAEMCGGEDGQFWADRGMGVVYGARIHLFVAFNLRDHRIWLFRDGTVDFVIIPPTTRGITIPGVEEPLVSIDKWWFGSYKWKY